MTNQEAINNIRLMMKQRDPDKERALIMAIKALAVRDKKRPVVKVFNHDIEIDCFRCGYSELCDIDNKPNYCRQCGGAFDWSWPEEAEK